MKITVTIREVYGKRTVYPACDKARTFADLLNTKTLTDRALQHIRDLGFAVEVAPQSLP